jgi:hypothetical protein
MYGPIMVLVSLIVYHFEFPRSKKKEEDGGPLLVHMILKMLVKRTWNSNIIAH